MRRNKNIHGAVCKPLFAMLLSSLGSAACGSSPDGSSSQEIRGADGAGGSGAPSSTQPGAPDGSSGLGPGDDPGAPARCARQSSASGPIYRTVDVNGVQRTYILYIPPDLDRSRSVPVVLVHHGFTMSGQSMLDGTSWRAIADEEGIVVAYPDGLGTMWNVGATAVCGAGQLANNTAVDDIGFVEAMLADADEDVCVDRKNVFITGFSMGGYFSNNVGCQRPDLVRALSPTSGGAEMSASCGEARPVLAIHGDADPLIAFDCGRSAAARWAEHNGCSTETDTTPVLGGHCERYRGCPPGGQVELCVMQGMGHVMSGGSGFYGSGPQYEDGARLSWAFFKEAMLE